MQFIKPNWPAPDNIFAFTTTRQKGNSLAPYASFNLAMHVGDELFKVEHNRQLLRQQLNLPSEPNWLQQIHGDTVAVFNNLQNESNPIADAAVTQTPNTICTVLTADCLPILLCNKKGTLVSAIHAGWRGLAKDVIENTIQTMETPPSELLAWLGPAIGPLAYEVSEDFVDTFISFDQRARQAFKAKPNTKNKWLANIYLLAKQRLAALGVNSIYGGEYCTFSDETNFYSFRRDGVTGRMATLIWLSA